MRTKGDLCGLTILEESEYGVVPSGTGVYSGTCLTLTDNCEATYEETLQCGARNRGEAFITSMSCGYTATFVVARGRGWEEWIERTVGSLSGVTRDIPSFTTVIRVSPSEVHVWTGCRVDSLTLTGSSIGDQIEFSVTVVARWHTLTPLQDADGTEITASPVAIPAGVYVTYGGNWEYSTDGGSTYERVGAKAFTLSLSSNLASDEGASSEDDEEAFGLAAGSGSAAQDSTITLDLTITSQDSTWDAIKHTVPTNLYFRAVIDGRTVILSGCNLDIAGPTRTQETYDETVSATATDIAVV